MIIGFYHRRHPERSVYRLLDQVSRPLRNWPEDFESRYGFCVKKSRVRSSPFLNTGFLRTVWRVCAARGVVMTSLCLFLRTRVVCPSCTTRRSLLFGEKVRDSCIRLRVRGAVRIIPFINDSHEVTKILKNIMEHTEHAPPLTPTDPFLHPATSTTRTAGTLKCLVSRPSRAGLLKAARVRR